MHANTIRASRVTVGTSGVSVSAADPQKVWAVVQSDPGNGSRIYLGGASSITSSTGAPSLAAEKAVTIIGAAAIYAVAGGASQTVLVLEGFR
jgi:hypothetical protein